jgi:glycosyltransferase involved in cell wall biosynthesis
MKPLVSILIPAFNAEQWIADTLRSAIAQTWPNTEILVVDDGSTDETLAIAKRFESKSIRVVSQRRQGGPAARNTAYSLSQGDYFQWLDNDDLLAPDKIERQVAVLEQCQSKWTILSSAWGEFMYRPRLARFVPTALWCDLSPAEFMSRKMSHNLFMQTAVWLVSRELTDAAGPWDTGMLSDDDGEYFSRVLLKADGIRFVPDARVYYRMTGPSRGSDMGRSRAKLEAKFRAMEMQIANLRSLDDSAEVRASCVKYLQDWLIHFYSYAPDLVRRAEELAIELGGRLEAPRPSWKYAWIEPLCGRDIAMEAQRFLPNVRWWLQRSWDKLLFQLESLNRSRQSS